jgi:hypothetical protein
MSSAAEWIGKCDERDRLDVEAIAKVISPDATALLQMLNSARVTGMMRIRREASTLAAKAQQDFRRVSIAAIVGTAIATMASGFLLYGAGSDAVASASGAPATEVAQGLVGLVKQNRPTILVCQILALLASTVAASALGALRLAESWAGNRTKAEALRREVFNEVLTQASGIPANGATAPDPACNPLSQGLEFFRRYQLELQIGYYAKAATSHEGWARTLTWLTALLAGLAAVTGAVAAFGGLALTISAFLGIAVPILLSAAQSWRAVSRDTDKADAYKKAKDALDTTLLDIDAVRKAAAAGDAVAVRSFVDKVHLILTTETDAWRPTGATA